MLKFLHSVTTSKFAIHFVMCSAIQILNSYVKVFCIKS